MDYVPVPKLSNKVFIERAKKVHGDKYDYSKVVYKNFNTKVKILCHDHGSFWQAPNPHLNQKQGCPKCKGKSKTTEEIIEEFKRIHGEKYNYDKCIYTGVDHQITITCKYHGDFLQLPRNHRKGHGCQKCAENDAHKRYKKSDLSFFKECSLTHNNKYDYSKAKYKNEKTEIKIICPEHGEFRQLAGNHLHKKAGCPSCANYGFDSSLPAILYYLKDLETGYYKIGITNRTVEERFGKSKMENIDVLKTWQFNKGEDAYELEQFLHSELKPMQILNENFMDNYGGFTEFYSEDILHLDISNLKDYK